MLTRLSVKNLAVVEEAEVAFGPGLNAITGETGAGKSVLLGALHLLLGSRAERGLIRTGAEEARVSAEFLLSAQAQRAVAEILEEAELPPCEEGLLILRRALSANGTGRIRVNDAPATAGLLRRLAPWLADIHGPLDNAALRDEAFQLQLLTAYADAAAEERAYAAAWQHFKQTQAALNALRGAPGEREAEQARLEEMLDEIHAAAPTEADGEELAERHAQAANAGEILALGNALTDALTDGAEPIAEQLQAIQRELRTLARLLPDAADWANELSGLQEQLQELSRTMAERLSRVEADPGALAQLEERLALIQRLRRRYGPSLADLLRHTREAEARLEQLQGAEGELLRLEDALSAAQHALQQAALALRARREAAAPALSQAITAELHELGFARSAFPIRLEPLAQPGPTGAERVIFCFEPNPGEAARPLAAIASSGEAARVMLAVKAILARHDGTDTLVFDEIDANIGGETARKVGEKLRALAEHAQVLCITHQPQAAVFAQRHLRVLKQLEGERTVTRIATLRGDERTAELARMLGGGEAAETHARALLAAQA